MDKFYFRRKRFKKFFQTCNVTEDVFILDVGGLPWDWIKLGWKGKVLCLSLSKLEEGFYGENKNIEYRRMDVINMPYKDQEIDVVYCNSLLEHVGRENQMPIAKEIRRVAKKYWIQVPYRYFFYEPHFKFPYYHIFPKFFRRIIANIWTKRVMKSKHYLNEVDSIHLPSKKEFRAMFPHGTHIKEWFGLHTKSLIAFLN